MERSTSASTAPLLVATYLYLTASYLSPCDAHTSNTEDASSVSTYLLKPCIGWLALNRRKHETPHSGRASIGREGSQCVSDKTPHLVLCGSVLFSVWVPTPGCSSLHLIGKDVIPSLPKRPPKVLAPRTHPRDSLRAKCRAAGHHCNLAREASRGITRDPSDGPSTFDTGVALQSDPKDENHLVSIIRDDSPYSKTQQLSSKRVYRVAQVARHRPLQLLKSNSAHPSYQVGTPW